MISGITNLLSRGAVISTLVVLLVLPAMFMDYFVNFLLKAIDKEWDMTTQKFVFPNFAFKVSSLLLLRQKTLKSLFLLKDYLKQIMVVQLHSETAWHNSHLSKQNTYYGYWAYEAGAVAKILDLDDEALKEQRYYPFDLVH